MSGGTPKAERPFVLAVNGRVFKSSVRLKVSKNECLLLAHILSPVMELTARRK